MILTGSIYDKKLPAAYKVLVMRRWPRGIKKTAIDLWLRDLGPSSELLNAYQKGRLAWGEFAEHYGAEVSLQADLLAQVKQLEHIHGKVTLLCWERHERCHRFILKEMLDQLPTSEHEGERE